MECKGRPGLLNSSGFFAEVHSIFDKITKEMTNCHFERRKISNPHEEHNKRSSGRTGCQSRYSRRACGVVDDRWGAKEDR